MSSFKSQAIGEEFDNFTLESEDVSGIRYGGLMFESLDEVIKVYKLVCLDEGKGVPK